MLKSLALKSSAIIGVTLAASAALGSMVSAESVTTATDGLSIAKQAKVYASDFTDFTANMKMILRDHDGHESTRSMRIKVLERPGDGDKSIVVFDLPRDVTGTALLTFTHRRDDDDQWLYLPALKRVKRIAADNKSGPFMGSEFSYEDIASQEVEKYTHELVGEESFDGKPCYVLDQRPVDANSGYTKRRVWFDKEAFRALKVEFYNRRNEHEKTLISSDYRKFLDHQWRALDNLMTNHLTGKSTELTFSDFSFKTGLSEGTFDSQRLNNVH